MPKKSSKKSLKEDFQRAGQAASEKAHEDYLKSQDPELFKALDPAMNPDTAKVSKETKGWSEIRSYVIVHFPEAKQHKGLSANQILAAIAHCIGWSYGEISKASGINKSTIATWLVKPEVKNLIREFSIKQGETSPTTIVKGNAYKGQKFIDYMLSLPPQLHDKDLLKIQSDLSKFSTAQGYGKAEENVNVNGQVTYKDVAEGIYKNRDKESAITEEEEDELFN